MSRINNFIKQLIRDSYNKATRKYVRDQQLYGDKVDTLGTLSKDKKKVQLPDGSITDAQLSGNPTKVDVAIKLSGSATYVVNQFRPAPHIDPMGQGFLILRHPDLDNDGHAQYFLKDIRTETLYKIDTYGISGAPTDQGDNIDIVCFSPDGKYIFCGAHKDYDPDDDFTFDWRDLFWGYIKWQKQETPDPVVAGVITQGTYTIHGRSIDGALTSPPSPPTTTIDVNNVRNYTCGPGPLSGDNYCWVSVESTITGVRYACSGDTAGWDTVTEDHMHDFIYGSAEWGFSQLANGNPIVDYVGLCTSTKRARSYYYPSEQYGQGSLQGDQVIKCNGPHCNGETVGAQTTLSSTHTYGNSYSSPTPLGQTTRTVTCAKTITVGGQQAYETVCSTVDETPCRAGGFTYSIDTFFCSTLFNLNGVHTSSSSGSVIDTVTPSEFVDGYMFFNPFTPLDINVLGVCATTTPSTPPIPPWQFRYMENHNRASAIFSIEDLAGAQTITYEKTMEDHKRTTVNTSSSSTNYLPPCSGIATSNDATISINYTLPLTSYEYTNIESAGVRNVFKSKIGVSAVIVQDLTSQYHLFTPYTQHSAVVPGPVKVFSDTHTFTTFPPGDPEDLGKAVNSELFETYKVVDGENIRLRRYKYEGVTLVRTISVSGKTNGTYSIIDFTLRQSV